MALAVLVHSVLWTLLLNGRNGLAIFVVVFVAERSQNQLYHRRNSDSDRCGISFYARSGKVE
jgi:hypothetical protein